MSLQPLLHKNKMWHEPPANAILMFKNTKSRNIKITHSLMPQISNNYNLHQPKSVAPIVYIPKTLRQGGPKPRIIYLHLYLNGVQVYTQTTIF